ncbi:MAG: MFS transporter, partial [Myxococcales bacterium]
VKDHTTLLAILASIAVGVAQFGSSVFLAQYFQVARGHTPTAAGLLMLPMVFGSMLGSAGSGAFITRTGEWKRPLILGSTLLLGGLLLMGTMDHTTTIWALGGYMILVGLGTGMLMQNIVLVVQNTVDVSQVGVASGVVTFFRSMGGAVGVAVLGAVLATSVHERIAEGLAKLGVPAGSTAGGNLDLKHMPAPMVDLVRRSYADATGEIFLIAGLATVLTLITVALMPRTELRTTIEKVDTAD